MFQLHANSCDKMLLTETFSTNVHFLKLKMNRVTKEVSLELIKYVKSVGVRVNYWDPKASSALEIARQMTSKRFKKVNPSLKVELQLHEDSDPGVMKVEYVDGKVWETQTGEHKASDLRRELFMHARLVEDMVEETGDGQMDDSEAEQAGGKGKGGDSKKSGKK